MKPGSTMRVARPTDNLAAIAEMYAKGLGFAVLSEFKDHGGFDGVILGHPRQPYHIEFTSQQGYRVGKAPTQDHSLVFYTPDKNEWKATYAQMISAGFRQVPSYNPYWDLQGKTLEDIDGYRVVLQNAAWTK
jgi:hypothetical protein